jgi:hypothetical protein
MKKAILGVVLFLLLTGVGCPSDDGAGTKDADVGVKDGSVMGEQMNGGGNTEEMMDGKGGFVEVK